MYGVCPSAIPLDGMSGMYAFDRYQPFPYHGQLYPIVQVYISFIAQPRASIQTKGVVRFLHSVDVINLADVVYATLKVSA